jgi:4-amino-4-deoxy-L-arabinose transferase-like glycosyltransferase
MHEQARGIRCMALTRTNAAILYLVIAAPLSLILLGSTDLIRMEPIIAFGARHMIESGDWFVPHLYQEAYAYKPALAYWMVAGSGSLFGWSEFSLRLPTAVCGMLLGLAICLVIGRLVSPRCGVVGGVAAVTSALFIEQARMVGFDMPMALGVGVATLAAIRNLSRSESHVGWWAFGYAGLLLAFLAKGVPAVVLFSVSLLAAAIVLKQVRLLLRWQHLLAASLFVLAVAAYLLPVLRDEGTLVLTQHLGEIVFRGTRWRVGTLLGTLAKPAVIFVIFIPASLLLLVRLVPGYSGSAEPAIVRLRMAAWAFLVAGVALFMVSPVHTTRYYLPLVTPLAVLGAMYVESYRIPRPAFLARLTLPRFAADPAVWMVVAACIYWVIFVSWLERRREASNSLRPLAMSFDRYLAENENVYVDTTDSYAALFWYLGRPVRSWHIESPLPPAPACVVLVDKQIQLGRKSRENVLTVLVEGQDHDGHRYALCRIGGHR